MWSIGSSLVTRIQGALLPRDLDLQQFSIGLKLSALLSVGGDLYRWRCKYVG
jgi:hypothetical protein